MKSSLVAVASAAILLLAGCSKSDFQKSSSGEGGMEVRQNVTFTASLSDGATKAAADNDGQAAYVNRCVMEVYYDGTLFAREYAKVTDKKATFTVNMVSERTYQVAFWADYVLYPDTQSGLQTDYFYTTTNGLDAVAVKSGYVGNDDKRDAFTNCGNYTIEQNGTTHSVTLKRPFSQINVITTDVATVAKVATLKPETVSVTINNAPTVYNALEKTVGTPANLTYDAPIYKWDATKPNATLSMDYVFASTEKALINIDWVAEKSGNGDVVYAFNDIPYQRNYRTNIKGALLTTTGKWNVTVDPDWDTPEIDQDVFIATNMDDAQDAVSTGEASTVIVKDEAVENRDKDNDKDADYIKAHSDIDVPSGSKAIEFVLTPSSNENVVLELPELEAGEYWYIRHEEGYPTGVLNINTSADASQLIIDVPDDTHVNLNGTSYSNVYASTGDNTLVVPVGTVVDKLTVRKGSVEIHGTVGELAITGPADSVKFHACEGLSAAIFAVIKGEDHDYIDRPKYSEKQNGDKWDIVECPFLIIRGGVTTAGYATIAEAIANAEEGDQIECCPEEMAFPSITKAGLTFISDKETKITSFGSAAKNTTIDGFNFATATGYQCCYEDCTIKNCKFTGDGNAIRYAYNKGTFTIDGCVFEQKGQYGIHFDGNNGQVIVKNSTITGSVAFAGTVNPTFTNCEFAGKGNCGYCNINIYATATFEDCLFSQAYTSGDKRGILMLGGEETNSARITVNNCKVTEGDGKLTDIFRTDFAQGVGAIDATTDSEGKYTSGTFVGADLSSVEENLAGGLRLNKLSEFVSVIGNNSVATIGDKEYFSYEEALAAAMSGEEVIIKNNGLDVEFNMPASMATDVTIKGEEGDYLKTINFLNGSEITNLTIKGFTSSQNKASFTNGFINIKEKATVNNLTVEGCVITGPKNGTSLAMRIEPAADASAKSIEFKDCDISGLKYGVYSSGANPKTTVKFSNTTFSDMYSWCILINNNNVPSIEFNGCTFNTVDGRGEDGKRLVKRLGNQGESDNFKFVFKDNKVYGIEPAQFWLEMKSTNATISGNTLNDEGWEPSIRSYIDK